MTQEAGVAPVAPGVPSGVEVVRRRSEAASYVFAINHTGSDAAIEAQGRNLLTGEQTERHTVPAGEVAVIAES